MIWDDCIIVTGDKVTHTLTQPFNSLYLLSIPTWLFAFHCKILLDINGLHAVSCCRSEMQEPCTHIFVILSIILLFKNVKYSYQVECNSVNTAQQALAATLSKLLNDKLHTRNISNWNWLIDFSNFDKDQKCTFLVRLFQCLGELIILIVLLLYFDCIMYALI